MSSFRLVVQDELLGSASAARSSPISASRIGLCVVEHRGRRPTARVRLLGDVHRDVGVLQQRGEVVAVVRGDGDAEAGLDVEASRPRGRTARRARRRSFAGRALRVRRRRPGRAAGRRTRRRRAARRSRPRAVPAQPRPDLLQQQVAVVVAERVVDLLEPVEVEQQQGDLPLGAVGALMAAWVRRRSSSGSAGRSAHRGWPAAGWVGLLAQPAGGARHQPEEGQPEEREPAEQRPAHSTVWCRMLFSHRTPWHERLHHGRRCRRRSRRVRRPAGPDRTAR